MKKIVMMSLAVVMAMGLMAQPVFAEEAASGGDDASKFFSACDDPNLSADAKATAGCTDMTTPVTVGTIAQNLIQVAIGIIGVAAVVVIVMGGQRYITSSGDAGKTKQARDMILYGVLSLIVALLAYAIVQFVIGALSGGGE